MPDDDSWQDAYIHVSIRSLTKSLRDKDRGETTHDDVKRSFLINIHDKVIVPGEDRRLWSRHYHLSHYLFHELVHVKQWITGQLKDNVAAKTYIWEGQRYPSPPEDDLEAYYTTPYEIDAYGRTEGLIAMFYKEWKSQGNE